MKSCVVFCTIRRSESFRLYAANFMQFGHKPDVIIVDEEGNTRSQIQDAFEGLDVASYGSRERKQWMRENSHIIPRRSSDEIGFSLLVAYPKEYDIIVFVDDDTQPAPNIDFVGEHWKSLTARKMRVQRSSNRWVNPHPRKYPRGYPYSLRHSDYSLLGECRTGSILNMGLWDKIPDLNAIDYLYEGSLEGLYEDPEPISPVSYILATGNYMPMSRMNLAFLPKITPAFYQLTGDECAVGRYGDVFSGLFLEKIASHLGDHISFGQPVCIHNKEPRDVFKDIKAEIESIKLNEKLWLILDKIELSGDSYASCYENLSEGLLKYRDEFHIPHYIDYLSERMKEWVRIVEKQL